MTEDLSDRKREILFAVVEDFIATAEPVGSSQVAKKKGISFSPATVRTVMAELEERGFLRQPHASAGRLPTDHGFRFFVDHLMRIKPLSNEEKGVLRQKVTSGAHSLNDILKDACRLVSSQTDQPGLIVSPRPNDRNLKHIQFIHLRGKLVLAVLVSTSGIVENKVLELDRPLLQSELDQMHNYLNEKLSGLTLHRVRLQILLEMKQAHTAYNDLLTQALLLGERALAETPPDMHIDGPSRLLSKPEFLHLDVEKMEKILRFLEEKTTLVSILNRSLESPGVKIFIGAETAYPEINGLTLIASAYSDSEGNPGVLGVIGPTRMDYARIVPLVEFTSQMVTDVLHEGIPA